MKKCCKCHQIKDLSSFWKNANGVLGLQPRCKPCHSEAIDKRKAKNTKLLKSFGISIEGYELLSSWWGDSCAICTKQETVVDKRSKAPRRLAVDHDHKLGHVRGVLCSKCNRGIGMFDENIELLKNAITYLESYKAALEEENAPDKEVIETSLSA